MTKQNIKLVIKSTDEGEFLGSILYKRKSYLVKAKSVEEVKKSIADLILSVNPTTKESPTIIFNVSYDLTSFFKQFEYINISKLADTIGLSPSLLRQYATGKKHPSGTQLKRIEHAIKNIGETLAHVSLVPAMISEQPENNFEKILKYLKNNTNDVGLIKMSNYLNTRRQERRMDLEDSIETSKENSIEDQVKSLFNEFRPGLDRTHGDD